MLQPPQICYLSDAFTVTAPNAIKVKLWILTLSILSLFIRCSYFKAPYICFPVSITWSISTITIYGLARGISTV